MTATQEHAEQINKTRLRAKVIIQDNTENIDKKKHITNGNNTSKCRTHIQNKKPCESNRTRHEEKLKLKRITNGNNTA